MNLELLKNCLKSRNVEKIYDVTYEQVVPAGQNYLGELNRMVIDVLKTDGQQSKEFVITKKFKTKKTYQDNNIIKNVAETEIMIYSKIIPILENLIRNDESQILWPKCLLVDEQLLYLEDLKSLGYEMTGRNPGLNEHHVYNIIKSLAQFHAISFIVIKEKKLDPEILFEFLYTKKDSFVFTIYQNGLNMLASFVEEWGEEWSEIPAKLLKLRDTLHEEIPKLKRTWKLMVLNHGDCWINNIMFKYDSDGHIESTKFVDYQITHYNSPAWDLIYLLHTSVEPSTRNKIYPHVATYYLEQFNNTLKLNNYSGQCPITKTDLETMMNDMKLLGLLWSLFHLTLTVSEIGKFDPTYEKMTLNEIFSKRKMYELVEYNLKQDLKYYLLENNYIME